MTRLGRIERRARVPDAKPPSRKRSIRKRLLRWGAVGVVLLALAALLWFLHFRVVAAGIVRGEVQTFTAPASVIVQEVFVKPGQWCEKGRPLVRLVARDAAAARGVLEAQLKQARLRLELVKGGAELEDLQLATRLDDRDRLWAEIEAAEAAVAGAIAEHDHAQRELAIYSSLDARGHASDRELDEAATAAATADAELAEARANLQGLRARWNRQRKLVPEDSDGTELRQTELALLEHAVREAQERLRRFDFDSGTRTIVAPFSGRVDRVLVTAGSHRDEGDPLVEIYDPASLYVVAYVEPADRDRFEVGTCVKMYSEGTSHAIPGVVSNVHLAWARMPDALQDSPRQPQPAITMRIDCDGPECEGLAPNMVLRVVGISR